MKLCCAVLKRLGLKGVKIAQNVVKVGVHTCLSNGHPSLLSNLNCEKIVKSETSLCIFANVWIKGGENSSNLPDALLSTKWASKSTIKF